MKDIFALYFSLPSCFLAGKTVGQKKPFRLVNESLSRFNQLFLMELVQKFGVQKYSFFSICLLCFHLPVAGKQH